MDTGSWIVFLLAVASWVSARYALSLTRQHVQTMWGSCLALMAVTAFSGLSNHPMVTGLLWPFLAGVMVGELGWARAQQWLANQKIKKEQEKALAKKRARSKKKAKHEG